MCLVRFDDSAHVIDEELSARDREAVKCMCVAKIMSACLCKRGAI